MDLANTCTSVLYVLTIVSIACSHRVDIKYAAWNVEIIYRDVPFARWTVHRCECLAQGDELFDCTEPSTS